MIDPASLPLFLLASLALLLMPGPAVLYIVARSLEQGRAAGLVSTLGIAFGTLFHVAAAALGVSAILMSSAAAFQALKWAGAAYLIWLGVRSLLSSDEPAASRRPRRHNLRRVFVQGAVVNLLNPKTALFFFAFLPQFADPGRGSTALQIVVLGLLFIAVAILTDGVYALLAGSLGAWLQRSRSARRAGRAVAGGTYVALGIALAAGAGRRS